MCRSHILQDGLPRSVQVEALDALHNCVSHYHICEGADLVGVVRKFTSRSKCTICSAFRVLMAENVIIHRTAIQYNTAQHKTKQYKKMQLITLTMQFLYPGDAHEGSQPPSLYALSHPEGHTIANQLHTIRYE
jgi:hypothetical protein